MSPVASSGAATAAGLRARRIAVVGCPGAGKTTLSNTLGARLGLPVIHLDEHYWRPGWVPTPRAEWRETHRALISAERWIIDGDYTSTIDLRLQRADLVLVLAYARRRCLLGVLRRWAANHGRAIQAPGCPERIDLGFLRWVWNHPTTGRRRLREALTAQAGTATVLELGSPRAAARWLSSLGPSTRDAGDE